MNERDPREDEVRIIIVDLPHLNHIGECLWGCCA